MVENSLNQGFQSEYGLHAAIIGAVTLLDGGSIVFILSAWISRLRRFPGLAKPVDPLEYLGSQWCLNGRHGFGHRSWNFGIYEFQSQLRTSLS